MNNLQQQILNDLEDLPENMQAEALDFVQFLKAKLPHRPQAVAANQPNGTAIAQIMERMAARRALSDIEDPSQWQRDVRKDRPLPGRND